MVTARQTETVEEWQHQQCVMETPEGVDSYVKTACIVLMVYVQRQRDGVEAKCPSAQTSVLKMTTARPPILASVDSQSKILQLLALTSVNAVET